MCRRLRAGGRALTCARPRPRSCGDVGMTQCGHVHPPAPTPNINLSDSWQGKNVWWRVYMRACGHDTTDEHSLSAPELRLSTFWCVHALRFSRCFANSRLTASSPSACVEVSLS